jgi:hypothetical protein
MTQAALILAASLAATLAWAPSLHAHATYNLAGSTGAGIGGSTPPGAPDDGSPTNDEATWTKGLAEGYAGALPVNWYAGMHGTTQIRTLQAGVAPNPPNGSLLADVNSHNAATDPDLPTDRVLAVGGLSWSDPGNSDQGWGMGLDYGVIHYTPLDEILAMGPVKFSVTLQDDPTDGVVTQLAFAVYGGWDASSTASRHQTFTTSPAPVDDPLGSTGLTLLDYAAATAPGQTISRSFALDVTHGGHYTVLVGALGGVSGQYQLTVATYPDVQLAQCEAGSATQLAACNASLDTAQADLAAATADADGDGVRDRDDACAGTPGGAPVDGSGCSQSQFCGAIDVSGKSGRKLCPKADWQNDEPVMKKRRRDCRYSKAASACQPAL